MIFAAACGQNAGTASHDTTADDAIGPVTIFSGGTIYTGLEDTPTVEAVAVADGAVLAVGARALIAETTGADATFVDLDGAAMYPGFTDAHAHLLGIGLRELVLNLEGTGSVADLVSTVDAALQNTEQGAPLYGRGWIETGWPEARMPTRDDLDPVSPNNPVILERADGHAAVVNSAALEAAGIGDDTPDPAGGRIERDETGRATGLLIDNAAIPAIALVGAPGEGTKREAYKRASAVYTAYGWTGLHNMSVDPANLDLMETASQDGLLQIRVYNSVDQSGLAALETDGFRQTDNGKVVTRAIKLYMDGALGSRGALLTRPYSDQPDTEGLLLMQKRQAMSVFERALEAGVQVNIHAIGDRANRLQLDWIAEAFAAHPERAKEARWRNEHTQVVHVEDIPRFAELSVIPSMQPSHAIGDL
jgi:predicted amidohydrolase YtcJ